MPEIEVWTFLPNDGRPRFDAFDGGSGMIVPGRYFTEDYPTRMRDKLMHGWIALLDALLHAHGFLACYARFGGLIEEDRERMLHATAFTALQVIDTRETLHRFACDLADDLLTRERSKGRARDYRLNEAVTAKRRCLDGDITKRDLQRIWHETARLVARDDRWLFEHPVGQTVRAATLPFIDESRSTLQQVKRMMRSAIADASALAFTDLNAELTFRVFDSVRR